jgi:hypothetical protein
MSAAAASHAKRISVKSRFVLYAALWLVAMMTVELLMRPEGNTETDLNGLQQRLLWPFQTPLLVMFGLAEILSASDGPGLLALLAAALCFGIHAIVTLTRTELRSFRWMVVAQGILLAIAVTGFLHFANLPSGP